MNRYNSRKGITAGVVITIALVSFFAWYAYKNMQIARDETRKVDNALYALRVLENLMDDMQDVETSNRGFIISGNPGFLSPFNTALKSLRTDTSDLHRLSAIFPNRTDTFLTLIALSNAKVHVSREAARMMENGQKEAALDLVKSGKGRELMDSIRHLILSLETTDRKVLISSNANRESAATNMARLFVLTGLSFILLLVLFFIRFRRDIKRREAYEERIRYLAGLTERTSDAIISINQDLQVITWNKGAELIYGFSQEEAVGRKIAELTKSSILTEGYDRIRRDIDLRGSAEYESNDFTKDGKSIFCQVSVTPLYEKGGALTGFVSVVRDITQRKLAEKLIYEFNHELSEKVKEKTEGIRKSEEKLRQVLDSAAGEFYVIDLDFRVQLISRMAERNLEKAWKYPVRTGTLITEVIPAEKKEFILQKYKEAFSGHSIDYDTSIEVDGVVNWLNVSFAPVWNNRGEITGAFVGTRDITARKTTEARLQESESRYRTLVEQASESIVVLDSTGRLIQANESALRLTGFTPDELPSLNLAEIVLINEGEPPLQFEALRKGKSIISNRKIRKKNGEVIEIEVSSKMLSNGDFIIVARDISERMRAQQALAESENRFRAIFNTQMQMVALLDREGRVLEVNKTALDITGFGLGDLAGHFFWDIRLWQNEEERPERIARLQEAIRRAANGELIRFEGEIQLPGKQKEIIDFSIKSIPGADGIPQLLIAEGRLITEIKKAEAEVKDSEAKYRAFFEHSLDGILLSKPDGSVLSANPSACRMFGMSEDEIIELGRDGLVEKSDPGLPVLLKKRKELGYVSGELQFVRKDGSHFPGEFTSALFQDAFGKERTSMIIRDITERKRIEQEIINSNQRFEMIARTTNDAVWEWNLLTGEKWANETHQALYGLTKADPVPDELTWRSRIHPDDRALIVNRQETILASSKNTFISEYRFQKTDGAYVYLFDRCYIDRNSAGEAVRMTGSMMDITDRKVSERKLKESEERLRMSMEAAKQGLYDLNVQTGETVVNEQYALMLGYDPASFRETNEAWIGRLHPDDKAITGKAYEDYITGKTSEYKVEFRQKTRSGEWKWILSIGKILTYDAEGKPLRMLGTHTDITTLKNAELEVIRSQKQFRSLVENISGVYWVNDLDTQRTLYISPSYETIWGRTCNELYHDPAAFLKAVHPDDVKQLTDAYTNIAEHKQFRIEYRIVRPDGDIRWVAAKINVAEGEEGHRTEYGYAEDITEQRRAEKELVESNARFQIVSKATSDLVWDWDLINGELWWNDNYYQNLGYKKVKEIVSVSEWYDRIHPDERERVRMNAEKTFRGKGSVWRDEYRYQKADGTYLHFLDRGFIMRDKSGNALRMIGSMIDMTPIYTVQRKIEESEMRLRTILDTDPECIKLLDKDIRLLDVNKAGLRMMETDKSSLIVGTSFLRFVHAENQETVGKMIRDVFDGHSGSMEFRMISLKGTERWCEMSVVPFTNAGGEVISALGVTRDISERKKAELAVRLSEEKYRTLVEQAADAIALYDAAGKILETNTSSSRLLGYTRKELTGMRLDQILLPEDIVENPVQYDLLSAGVSTVKIRRMRRKDGSVVVTEVRSQRLPDGRFLSVIRDMTERIKAEEELKASFTAVRKLTAYLQNIREEERANIAREIHDELGQQLTVLKMDIAWLNKRFKGVDTKVDDRLKDLLQMLDETVQSVRRISSQLRPSLLDDLGLTAAMEWQLGEFEKRAGVHTVFHAPKQDPSLEETAKTALFRIFQESLTNVARHAEASLVSVSLIEKKGQVTMTVSDDGKGFDQSKLGEKRTLGILGMKERTEMIGGRYEISSQPGGGTTVMVSVPLHNFNA